MIKNILLPLTGTDSDSRAAVMALKAATLFSGRVHAVHFRPGPGQLVQAAAIGQCGSGLGTVELIHALEKAAQDRARAARASFDTLLAPNGVEHYREVEGDEVEGAISQGRFHDLVVLGRPTGRGKYTPGEIGHILVSCGRPVVLAPEGVVIKLSRKEVASALEGESLAGSLPAQVSPSDLAGSVAIAWKETAEAARAVTAAMPFLMKADKVVVLAGEENDAGNAAESAQYLATQLGAHGIGASAESVALHGKPAAAVVLERAAAHGAGLLVMGGYGHSRRREWVFGGFTREVLRNSQLPVLLFH